MQTPPTDEELLARARAGQRDATITLLERNEPQIYRFALRMCASPEDARDVLQETLVAAFKGLREFRGDARLSTWLFQVARSYCTKATRRRAGEPVRHEPLDAPAAARVHDETVRAPDALAHAREVGEVLRAALAALPVHYREVVLLKDVHGLSLDEVAEVLGEPVPGIKSRLHRARLELRGLLRAVLDEQAGAVAPCAALAEELAGYAAGDIDRSACQRMEAHMARCPQCTQACESLKDTVRLCSSAADEDVPAAIKAAVRQALGALRQP